MLDIHSGYFDEPKRHHPKWFSVFRFTKSVEIWMGHRYVLISWGR